MVLVVVRMMGILEALPITSKPKKAPQSKSLKRGHGARVKTYIRFISYNPLAVTDMDNKVTRENKK